MRQISIFSCQLFDYYKIESILPISDLIMTKLCHLSHSLAALASAESLTGSCSLQLSQL